MLLAGALLALPLLTACAGAQSDQAATPSDDDVVVHVINQSSDRVTVSAMYEVGPGMGLGSVPPGSEAAFTFFWRAGELRMVVDYLERKTTSNGLVYVDRGDVLELVVTDREPVLRRRQ
jgi:hypothetical protein